MTGWIKLHRGLTEWEWYTHLPTKTLFIHLLLTVNHKQVNWRGVTIEKGGTVTGRDILAKETGLTVSQIRTALKNLKSTNEIAIKTSSQGTVIQVVKYEDYQELANDLAIKSPSNRHQIATNKNDKNKEDIVSVFSFEDFWNLYDKKRERKNCEAKYKQISEKDRELIKEHLPKYVKAQPEVQFRKDPIRYLRHQLWLDEIVEASTGKVVDSSTVSTQGMKGTTNPLLALRNQTK